MVKHLGIERLPVKAGSASKPMPGYHVQVLDDHDEEAVRDEIGYGPKVGES